MKFLKTLARTYLSGALMRGGMAIFAGTMVSNVASYLYHVAVGRILGPVEYGELASLLSLSYIFNVPISVIQTVLVKHVSILKARSVPGEAKRLFLVSTKYLVLAVLVGFVGIFLVSPGIADYLNIESSMNVIWVYVVFGIGLASVVPGSIIMGYQMFGVHSVLGVVGTIFRLISGLVLAPFGVTWTLIGSAIYSVIMYGLTLLQIPFILVEKSKSLSLRKKDIFNYSVPTFLTLLGVIMLNQQDVILVKHFFSAHDAGIYSAMSILGKIIFFASSPIGLVIFPAISERVESKKPYQHIVIAAMGFVLLCSVILNFIFFMFPTVIAEALYGTRYVEAAQYLGIFGIFISFFSFDNLLMNICLAVGKTKIWIITLGGALVQISLLYFYHDSLLTACIVNLIVAAGIFVVLSTYYILTSFQLKRNNYT